MKRSDVIELNKEDVLNHGDTSFVSYDNAHDFINDIEDRLNSCLKDLENIKSIRYLDKIVDIWDELKDISQDLY